MDRFVVADAGIVVGETLLLALAAFRYAGSARRSLAALKYAGAGRLAPMLADAALPALEALVDASGLASMVPVPIHPERRRTRGYNQAELLADGLANRVGMDVRDVLRRVVPTTRQHRLNRAARLRNLRAAIAVAPGAAMPKVAILVDDIITTAATLEACASALMASGCERVYGFAIAREV
ncbi:MAG: ComF family protein [Chloroflexi bacterium]|nr:ComF family protein [Chloroflexota bacterium]